MTKLKLKKKLIKKLNDFRSCKMCGEKQSVKQIFWTGPSAKEGREQVQALNRMRGDMEAATALQKLQQAQDSYQEQEEQEQK